jgi:putative ubiquitin-RnfH superfamily antitoxin RatB of RatAB toxin-antitoxin module
MSKRCTVACDTPARILVCELDLPNDATIGFALSEARRLLGDSAADWEHAATGIYGRVCGRGHIPADGDRIELYRPLNIDPRAQRRARAAKAARAARARGNRAGRGPRRG